MSYLAIARKYRPATFAEIVGQDHVTRTLQNAIERQRIHHGFLFTGARGVGKTTAARALARSLNCQEGPSSEPCGTCTSCVEISQGMSPDLIEIDGASNNSVEDVRELRETVRYAPTRGQWKIYLVDEVHMLSKGAFNALLKTLEEPPAHVIFIFATTEPNRIPDTILSRVQRFDFKRIPIPAVVGRLREIAETEQARISDNALRMIARAGEGSMRDAQSLLDQVISFAGSTDGAVSDDEVAETLGLIDRSLLYEMLGGLVAGQPDQCLAVIDRVYGYGYELSQFTGEMLEVLRNATFVRLSPDARRYIDVPEDELKRIEEITADVPPDALTRTFDAMIDVHDQVSRASRPRIVLEMSVARLATRRPVQPVGALLGRLDDLERRLRQGGAAPPRAGMRSPRSPRASRASASRGDDDGRSRSPGVKPPEPPKPPKRAAPPKPPPPKRRPSDDGPPLSSYEGVSVQAPDEDPGPPPLSPDATPEQRWSAFCERLKAAKLDQVVHGEPYLAPGMLRISFKGGRAVANARLKAKDPAVDAALRSCYPEGTVLEIVARARQGSGEALIREALADPSLKRIVEALGANPLQATPLSDGDTR